MQPTMTMTKTATANDGADAPQQLRNAVIAEIFKLTPKERKEMLSMIKRSRCEQ